MRRLTITISVLAIIAALLPAAALVAAAQEVGPAPQIAPPTGKAAVRASDAITVSGDATGMQEPLSAKILGIAADGGVMFRQAISEVRVSGGQYAGTVGLGCGFGEPDSLSGRDSRCEDVNPDADGQVAGVAIEIEGAARSNVVRVDYTDPEIVRYELVDSRTVRVVFSEPVRMQPNPLGQRNEKAADWAVDDLPAVAIADPKDSSCPFADDNLAQGCTRLLTLAAPVEGEDATPFVDYLPLPVASVLAPVYVDFADNNLGISSAENSEALDRIRPAVPNIAQINGTNPSAEGAVIDKTTEPSVTLTNLTAGHSVQVSVKRDGAAPIVVDQAVPEDPAAGEGQSSTIVAIPELPGEGDYLVTAVATDAAGNRSDEASKRGPGRADGPRSSASYIIDTTLPVLVHAGLVNTKTVEVVFSEDVTPADGAGTWMMGDEPLEASGTGDARTLTATNDLQAGQALTWQPSATTYSDRANNALAPLAEALDPLPPLPTPSVTTPARPIYRSADQQRIAGTHTAGPGVVAELFERGAEKPVQTIDAGDSTWAFTAALNTDKRYQYQVRLHNPDTGVSSPRATVPDIVRDTTAPVVEVLAPASAGLPYPAGALPEYGVGDSVTVEWRATDTATNDPKLEDHGSVAHIVMVRSDGVRRTIASGIQHQPGQRQRRSYKLTTEDLGGSGMRDFTFDVSVRDLAGNVGTDTSGAVRLLASRLGYTPVLVAARTIEARFTRQLQGAMAPGDWLVDGTPAAAQLTERNGNTIVILTAPLVSDPNARSRVKFSPSLPPEVRLRSSNDTQISTTARTVLDRIKPVLEVEPPATPAVIDANSVKFTGTTDETEFPNTIAAYRSDATGARKGPALKTTRAKTDGTWAFNVPLDPNRRNWIVLRASDPSGNRSTTQPSDPYTVVEDSIAPAVRLLNPSRAGTVGKTLRLRWRTVEANKRFAQVAYRLRNGSWKAVTTKTADDGAYKWSLPKGLNRRSFQVRVRAYDRTGKAGAALSKGLLGDFDRPVLRRAKAVGERKVRLFFNERMDMTRKGFKVDGIGVRRVVRDGAVQTLILNRTLNRTTPRVEYSGTRARDLAGNKLANRKLTAERGFVFSVTELDADRLSSRRVRLEWRDGRNRSAHVKQYRIYRNGRRIGTMSRSARSFKDTNAAGANRYVVKAVDNEGRVSTGKAVRTR